jgi:cytochrome c oxidase subunit 2
MAAEIDWLHQVVMWIILVIFVGVFGFMFYACYAHRRSVGHKASSSTRTPRSRCSGP